MADIKDASAMEQLTDIVETEPGLTGYQQQLLDVIRSFHDDNKRGPTAQELANRLGSSGIVSRLQDLARAGYIKVESMMRPIELTDKGKPKPIVHPQPVEPPIPVECMHAGIIVAQVVDGKMQAFVVDAAAPLEAAVRFFESPDGPRLDIARPVITVDADGDVRMVTVRRSTISAEYA